MTTMLRSTFQFEHQLKSKNPIEKYLVWFFLLLYTGVNLYFGFNEDATWDDDCPTRYYNTLNAFDEPHNFISVWNRPLFVLIFSPIVHLGRNSIFVSMVILTAIGAYYLYRGLKNQGIANAFMVLPFLLFQTYFFTISRNAETEPISVALICFGFYFLTKKNWLAFAIIGGLMPLARLELSVLLLFWGWYLLKETQYKYILILGLPTVLWNIAGGIIEGDFLYVINETIGKENATNRYGHTTFGHYFQRYIYVVGPIIYLFFIIGMVDLLKRLKLDFFIFWQMVIGFFLYVIFSWKLNIGNSAGFLRNLIPLAPLTALIALEGYNYIWETFAAFARGRKPLTDFDEEILPAKTFDELTDEEYDKLNTKAKKAYDQKFDEWELKAKKVKRAFAKTNAQQEKRKVHNLVFVWIFIIATIGTVYYFHSYEIKSHHKLNEEVADYTNLYSILAVLGVLIIMQLLTVFTKLSHFSMITFGVIFGLGSLAFTGITEPPNKNMSPERDVMQEISELYVSSYLKETTTYVNHIWFFWATDLDKYDTIQYKLVTIANLEKANVGDICIYETHYSHRLAGDVPNNYFDNKKEWVELTRKIAKDNSFQCVIFQKTDTTFTERIAKINKFLTDYPNDFLAYFSKGNLFKSVYNIDSSLVYYNKALSLDSSYFNVFYSRGLIHFNAKNFDLAIKDFKKTFELNKKNADALHNIGACYSNLTLPDSALVYYDKAIAINPKYENAYANKAQTLVNLGKKDEALEVYSKAISINNKNETIILNRAQLYYEKQDWMNCILDLTNALKINGKNANALLIRGICYLNLKSNDLGCKDWASSAALGNPQANQFIMQYCK
jgi:tetratricopeptide (TPR) repeat protein